MKALLLSILDDQQPSGSAMIDRNFDKLEVRCRILVAADWIGAMPANVQVDHRSTPRRQARALADRPRPALVRLFAGRSSC